MTSHVSLTPTEEAQQYITAFLHDALTASLPPGLLDLLRSNKLTLLGLIRLLGDALQSSEEESRGKGLRLLCLVVLSFSQQLSEAKARANGDGDGDGHRDGDGHDVQVQVQVQTQVQTQVQLLGRQETLVLCNFLSTKVEDAVVIADALARRYNDKEQVIPGSLPHRFKGVPTGAESLVDTIRALASLTQSTHFAKQNAAEIAENILTHITPSHYPQAVRYEIYRLLDLLISNHRSALFSTPERRDAFLKGYIKLVEGEKDPRNLLFCFAMDHVLMRECQLSPALAESFFDVTYCYFPITFVAPPNDPYGISNLDLTLALRQCLTCTPSIAPFAMPLLLEKLAASGGKAKMETLRVLEQALPVFGQEACLAHVKRIWEGVKIEILHATDEATSYLSERVLVSLLRVLYADAKTAEGQAPVIVSECLEILEEPSKSLAGGATTILSDLVRASISTSYLAIFATLDQLLTYWKNVEEVEMRGTILRRISKLVEALRQAHEGRREWANEQALKELKEKEKEMRGESEGMKIQLPMALMPAHQEQSRPASNVDDATRTTPPSSISTSQRDYDTDQRPLDPFRSDLISCLSNALQSTSFKPQALQLLSPLLHIRSFLDEAEIKFVLSLVNELIVDVQADGSSSVKRNLNEDVRVEALRGLKEFASVKARLLEETTLPLLFGALPDRIEVGMPNAASEHTASSTSTSELHQERLQRTMNTTRLALSALASLCAQPDLFSLFVPRVFNKLQSVCPPSSQPALSMEAKRLQDELNGGYARGLLETLRTLLQSKEKEAHTDLPRYASDLLPRLLALVIDGAISSFSCSGSSSQDEKEAGNTANDWRFVQGVGEIVCMLVKFLTLERQERLSRGLHALVLRGTLDSALALPLRSLPTTPSTIQFCPLTTGAPPSHRAALPAILDALRSLDKAVSFPPSSPDAQSFPSREWTEKLLEYASASAQDRSAAGRAQERAARAALCVFFNKNVEEPLSASLVELLDETWEQGVLGRSTKQKEEEAEEGLQRQRIYLRCYAAMVKGMVARNSKAAPFALDRIMRLFQHAQLGRDAARCLGDVAPDEEGLLSKKNGAVLKLLHKQRFYSFVIPRIVDGFRTSQSEDLSRDAEPASERPDQRNKSRAGVYLLALSSLLPSMPRQTILERLKDLFPLLILALDLQDSAAKASAATTIAVSAAIGKKERREDLLAQSIPEGAPTGKEPLPLDLVEQHFGTIVTRLVAAARPAPSNPESTRIAALRALAVLARTVSYAVLHPHKVKVIRTLAEKGLGIDDPRREVRIEGVDTREAWLAIKGQNSEDT